MATVGRLFLNGTDDRLDGDAVSMNGAGSTPIDLLTAGLNVKVKVHYRCWDDATLDDAGENSTTVMTPTLPVGVAGCFTENGTYTQTPVADAQAFAGVNRPFWLQQTAAATGSLSIALPTFAASARIGAVTSLAAVGADGAINVSWAAPGSGSPLAYQARIKEASAGTYGAWEMTDSASAHQFAPLTNGVNMDIQVRALDASGAGAIVSGGATSNIPASVVEWSDLFPGTTLNAALWTTVSGTPMVGDNALTLVTGTTTTAVRSLESVHVDAASILRVAVHYVETLYYDGEDYVVWTEAQRKLQLRRVGSETIDVDVWVGESAVRIEVATAAGLRYINNSNEWVASVATMTGWVAVAHDTVVYIDIEFDGSGAIRFVGSRDGHASGFTTPWITPTGGDVGWNVHLTNHLGDWDSSANKVKSVDYSMVV